MDSSTIAITGTTLGAVNLAVSGGIYYRLNNRISLLENNSTSTTLGSGIPSTTIANESEVRITCLENQLEVLLERLDAYDKIFTKLMYSIKEISSHDQNQIINEIRQPYHTSIRRRNNPLIEHNNTENNIDKNKPTTSPKIDEINDESDDEFFSFLKN